MKALMIAGDRSGSGKTSITLAIAAILSRSMNVQTFKVGMDYIDPSYLSGVTGRPCRNLDSFVQSSDEIREIFDHGRQGGDIVLVEGVRGLYEGGEALGDQGSSASIAKLLGLPIILVVSARSITRSAAAIVKGFQAFDEGVDIRGVILNNVAGEKHIAKATAAIEHYCGIPVVGTVPRQPEMELAMRHLGHTGEEIHSLGNEIDHAVQAGDTVGYGSRFTAEGPTTIGVAACGYADGYPRHCDTGTPVLVNGVRTRLVGRVSMDMVTVDLNPVIAAGVDAGFGSEVTLWGRARNGAVLPIDEVAQAAGTVGYELMCALAPRVPVAVG